MNESGVGTDRAQHGGVLVGQGLGMVGSGDCCSDVAVETSLTSDGVPELGSGASGNLILRLHLEFSVGCQKR